MDTLLGINANLPVISIGASGALTSTAGLLASELNIAIPSVPNGGTTSVELSAAGQLLSAAATFKDQLKALQPGSATSGGGVNFGTDLASLAAETQDFVSNFNRLQNTIVSIGTSNLLGTGLIQSLNTLAQGNFVNGSSGLTNLAQLGVAFKPAVVPGAGSSLNIDLNTLKSAFNTDPAGAFSLLSKTANAFSDLAGNFVTQAGNLFSSLAVLNQTSAFLGSTTNSMLSQTPSSGSFSPISMLLAASQSGTITLQQAINAINEYSLVSSLLG